VSDRKNCGRRYPLKAVRFARVLVHERGYSVNAAMEALRRQGFPVAYDTVRKWCSESVRERSLELRRERERKRRALSSKEARREYLLAQAQVLIDAGLSYAAVSIALQVYEGDTLKPETIRGYLGGGRHRHDGIAGVVGKNAALGANFRAAA
jgi:hypothetical protein